MQARRKQDYQRYRNYGSPYDSTEPDYEWWNDSMCVGFLGAVLLLLIGSAAIIYSAYSRPSRCQGDADHA